MLIFEGTQYLYLLYFKASIEVHNTTGKTNTETKKDLCTSSLNGIQLPII